MCIEHAAVALLLLAATVSAGAVDEGPATPAAAIAAGKPALDLRYRYEHVDQADFAEDADASTLRVRLNYETGRFHRFNGFIEFDYVSELLVDDFNSGGGTSPDRARFPVIADPDGADLNQLYADYRGVDGSLARIGRQRILVGNQRFVGGVGWRQNEQTFDAVTLRRPAWPGAELHYSYIWRVNRIFGDRSPEGRSDGRTHLLNIPIRLAQGWTLTPFLLAIDNDDEPALSTRTFGLRADVDIDTGARSVSLAGEYATQTDAASAPVSYRADYLRLGAGVELCEDLSIGLGFETLGGDSGTAGKAFRTPLATLHAFQGWADQFVSTPDAGVDDLFVSVNFNRRSWDLQAVFHRFTSGAGHATWGNEMDLSAGRRIGGRYDLLLKFALFNADDPSFTDVTKIWLMLTAGF